MGTPLAVLIVEDSESDAALIIRMLGQTGYEVIHQRVEDAGQMAAALKQSAWDIVIADYSLPQFDAPAALNLLQETGLDIPFIVVSGNIGEEVAVAMMRSGAHDYLLKDNLARLAPAVTRELAQAEMRQKRQQADAQLRLQSAALEAVANAIIITNPQGPIQWINPAFTKLTGYTAAESIGKNPKELVKSGQHDHAFYKNLWDTILSGQVWHSEIINRRKDGSLYTEEETITPLRDAQGEISHFIAIKQDITARKALETENQKLTAQFYQSQKMEAVGQLTAGIAHDFNNLLMGVTANAELMQLKMSPEDPHWKLTEAILHSGSRAADLIRQLLIFSRKQIIEPQIFNLNDTVIEANNLLKHIIGEHIQVTIKPGFDLWPINADPGQLEQVIVNLAVNARDVMPDGGKLIIETGNVELDKDYAAQHLQVQPGEYVLLTISDTGVGMSQAIQDRIFEPFFTTKEQGKGTGLGLSTVFGIIKQGGGHIEVYSEVGRGSCFKVYLPRTKAEVTALAPQPKASKELLTGQETILVVDDAEVICTLIHDVLQHQGYTLLIAQNGQEALEVSTRHSGSIDLLLTDIVMPGMSGKDLAEQLIESRPQLKVIFMSGYTDEEISYHGVLGPSINFLQKPFSLMDMGHKVRQVLDD